MSFFADLLAGGAAGFGKLMGDQADIEDKRNLQLELQREKQQAALDLQRQRAEDRAFQIQLANDGKADRSSGSGGPNVMDMVMRAAKSGDADEQQRVLGVVESFGGKNAALQIADKVFGKPVMQERTTETVDVLGDGSYGGNAKVLERAAYIAEKGAQEFQRLYALTANKGDTKGHAQGEDQYLSNDLRATGIEQALKQGKPLDQASAYGSKVGDPATYDKNKTNADRVDVSEKNAQARLDAAEARRLADVARAEAKTAADLDKAILDYEKLKKNAGSKDRAVYDAVILDLKTRRQEAAPAKPAIISNNGRTATGTITAAPNVQDAIKRFTNR